MFTATTTYNALNQNHLGRFLSPDPYGQFYSAYTGLGNNPVNLIDPSGGITGGPLTEDEITTIMGFSWTDANMWAYTVDVIAFSPSTIEKWNQISLALCAPSFWESSWIMRYVSPISEGGGSGNADGSISVASSSGSRPTNNSGSTNEFITSLHVWRIAISESDPDEYGTNSEGNPPSINVLNDDFEKVVQENTNWCVFAVTEIIYNEFGSQIDQSDIANDFYNKIGVPENSNLPVNSLKFVNEYFQSDDNYFVRDFKDIAKALKQGHPILAGISVKNSNVGHAIYIYGVDNLNGSYKFHYWDTGSKASYTISSFDLAIKIQFAYVVKDPF